MRTVTSEGNESDPADLRSYYAARAREYDRVYLKPERQADLRAIEAWLPPVLAGRSLLEVACGTGYWTQFLAPAVSRLVALDAAPETLQIARERIPADHVAFALGDAYSLPFMRGTFDNAFAGFWFSHVPKGRLRAFLDGLHAALAPGAKVVFLDNRFVAGSSTPVCGSDAEGNTYQERRLADGSVHRILKNFPSEQELREAAGDCARSFRHVQWEYYWAVEYLVQ